jgi:ribosomal protein S12 methylthiotransferase accessory factor
VIAAADSMQSLLAVAASLLRGDNGGRANDIEARRVLDALDYDVPAAGAGIDSLSLHRANLLHAASRFARLFQLGAPDAPGLICFGAEFDPALADPMHAGSPSVGVSGVGTSLQQAFQACVGEGIEYLSQLQRGSDALVSSDQCPKGTGSSFPELLAALAECRLQPARGLSWYRATHLIDGGEVLLPADLCLRRPPAQREVAPPFPLSIGSAAGASFEAAALHGLLELIERDAAGLWWRGGRRPRMIPPEHEASVLAGQLLQQLRRSATSRRAWLLDITTDLGVPCVAAISCQADGYGFAFGLAARPTVAAAVRSAISEMCQLELAYAVVAAKRRERGDDALNDKDRTHLRRATLINADECALLQPIPEPAAHMTVMTSDPGATLRSLAQHLGKLGNACFVLDLTRPQLAVPVARVIAPRLQIEPSEIVTARLAETIKQTGGGTTYTGGIALL